ncbi:nuclear transport factor 2 family protein [Acidovorax sp. LjRoot74]|uniref:nuclear transport factor 2 family protein n=1 Tax=Acidovorax sp. LjRoot74 TaxID=3342337 RepID=UPI003ECD2F43
MSQQPLQSIWDTYTASWKTNSAADRETLFSQSLDPDCTYNDPLATAQGWSQLTAYMDDFHRQVPGGHFVTHYFASHNQQSIAKWNMLDGSGQVIGEGVSYGRYNDQNRLVAMTGFFDTP